MSLKRPSQQMIKPGENVAIHTAWLYLETKKELM